MASKDCEWSSAAHTAPAASSSQLGDNMGGGGGGLGRGGPVAEASAAMVTTEVAGDRRFPSQDSGGGSIKRRSLLSQGAAGGDGGGRRVEEEEEVLVQAPEVISGKSASVIVLRGGFEEVTENYFRDDVRKKGGKLVEHVLYPEEERAEGNVTFRAQCIRGTSIRENPYKVELVFSEKRELKEGRCSCRAGINAQCKHAAATFHFINQERSLGCTDREQRWQKPSQRLENLYPKGDSIDKLLSKKETPNHTFKVHEEKLQEFASQLEEEGMTSASFYKTVQAKEKTKVNSVSVQEEEVSLPIPILNMLWSEPEFSLPSRAFTLVGAEKKFYEEEVRVTLSKKEKIFRSTTGQSLCPDWFSERKKRVTASTAHKIWKGRKPQSRQSYFHKAPLDLPSLRYGRAAEARARKAFEEKERVSVVPSGLVISTKMPWMSASPDGFVIENDELSLLEIKCPFSCREKEIEVRYIKDGKLDTKSEVYTQVQCQMFVCDVKKCDLFVYSDRDSKVLRIERDEEFL